MIPLMGASIFWRRNVSLWYREFWEVSSKQVIKVTKKHKSLHSSKPTVSKCTQVASHLSMGPP